MSPEYLRKIAKQTEDLRVRLLFNEEEDEAALAPISEQHFLLGMAALENAHRFFKLSAIYQERKE